MCEADVGKTGTYHLTIFYIPKHTCVNLQAGITTGYQEKPCLDPLNSDCPDTAPNRGSKEQVDVGAELTGGCYGFAGNYMHWPEHLIVGQTVKNKTGHIQK